MSSRLLLPAEIEDEFVELEMLLNEEGCRRLHRIRGFLLQAYRERDDAVMEKRRGDLGAFEEELKGRA